MQFYFRNFSTIKTLYYITHIMLKNTIVRMMKEVRMKWVTPCLPRMWPYMIKAHLNTGRVKRICYLSSIRTAKVQASLRIRAVSSEPPLLAHTSSESRGTFRQKARYRAPLSGWACAVKISHDGMFEDTKSLDGAHTINCWVHDTFVSLKNRNLINQVPDSMNFEEQVVWHC